MAKKRRRKKNRIPKQRLRRAISDNVRALREEAKLSQPALAKKSGVSWATVRAIEGGYHSNPTMLTLVALARAFGVTEGQLIGTEIRE